MQSLQPFHTFSLPYRSNSISTFDSVEKFIALYRTASQPLILGEGSNTVFLDDYEGDVLVNKIEGIQHCIDRNAHSIRVGAGENWHKLISRCLKEEWYGMENLALIPGSVGASPIQNIGAYGVEVAQFIDSVEFIDLSTFRQDKINNTQCKFGYRDSIFKNELAGSVLITHVNFLLPRTNRLETKYGELAALVEPTPEKIFNQVVAIRQSKLPDPAQIGNAGSFFKNPVIPLNQYLLLKNHFPAMPCYAVSADLVKIPAAWLIDHLGFKGMRIGGAQCHSKQALVLANVANANGEDVLELASQIMTKIKDVFQIDLEPEVRLIGKNGLINL